MRRRLIENGDDLVHAKTGCKHISGKCKDTLTECMRTIWLIVLIVRLCVSRRCGVPRFHGARP